MVKKGRINDVFTHATAEVSPLATIGNGTKIWRWVHVEEYAQLGANCMLGQNVHIGPGVKLGNNVRVQDGVSIYRGVVLCDDVFVGPHAVFTNVKYPKIFRQAEFKETLVKKGATIGANV